MDDVTYSSVLPPVCVMHPPVGCPAVVLDLASSTPPVLIVGRPGQEAAWTAVLVGS